MITFDKLFKTGYEENSTDSQYGLIRVSEDGNVILQLNVSSAVAGNPVEFNNVFDAAVQEAGVDTADFREAYKNTPWRVVETF